MAPPPSTAAPPLVALIVRIATFVALLVSIIVLATNTPTTSFVDTGIIIKHKFSDSYAYRYLMATSVIGMLYTLFQIASTVYLVSTGNRLGGDGLVLIDFYGDKILSYMLISGAAAAFGLSVNAKRLIMIGSGSNTFLNRGNAAASFVLIGFLFSAISSIFSSLSVPKRS